MNNQYTGAIQKLDFESAVENLRLVERLIDQVCEEYHVNQDHYGNILIALTEAVNNAILHGNKSVKSKKIYISFEPQQRDLLFTVEDQGEGFDYNSLPDPTDPANIDKPSGRGVFLMKHLADTVNFHDKGRKVELVFKNSAN
jgi:serine/threonine-protein kinase RsbW